MIVVFSIVALFVFSMSTAAFGQDESDDDEELIDLDALSDPKTDSSSSGGSVGFGKLGAVFSGEILTKISQDIQTDNEEEFLFADFTLATAKAAVTVNPQIAVSLAGLFEYEVETNWRDTRTDYSIELWEGHGRFKLGPVDLTIGQQHVAWGIADALNPTDMVNPRDYDRLLDSELGYSKLPAPMLRVEYYMPENLKLDLVVLPFFRPAKFHIVGQDVALFAHNFPLFMMLAQLRENPEWERFEKGLEQWYPGWEEDLDALMEDQDFYTGRTRQLEHDFTHTEGALRFSGSASQIDFALCYMYLWDDIPTLHINPAFIDLMSEMGTTPEGYTKIPYPNDIRFETITDPFSFTFHRSHAVGLDFGSDIEGVGIRVEGAYTFEKYSYTVEMDAIKKPVLTWVLNIDYMFEDQTLIEAIFLSNTMVNYSNQMMMQPTYNVLMLAFRRPWLDDKLTTELMAAYDFSYLTNKQWRHFDIFKEDGMVSPYITYAILDPLKITIGANLVFGEKFHLFGALKDNSRVFTTLTYSF